MKTGIIIQCYNEEQRLNQEAFISFVLRNKNYHLCFVNDGSTDSTLKMLTTMQSIVPNGISVIDVKKHSGRAASHRIGAKHLYSMEAIAYIGILKADLSTDFQNFKNMVHTLKCENKFVVLGFQNETINTKSETNYVKRFFINLIEKVIFAILDMSIKDTQYESKVFVRNVVPVIYGEAFISKWLFDIEILLRLKNYVGKDQTIHKIFEQPIKYHLATNKDNLGIQESMKVSIQLAFIGFYYYYVNSYGAAWRSYSFDCKNEVTDSKLFLAA